MTFSNSDSASRSVARPHSHARSASKSSDRAYDRLIRLARDVADADHVHLTLVEEQRLVHLAHVGTEEAPASDPDASLAAEVVRRNEAVVLAEPPTDGALADLPKGTTAAFGSVAGIPVQSGAQAIGALCVRRDDARAWEAATVERLHDVAALAADALEASRPAEQEGHASLQALMRAVDQAKEAVLVTTANDLDAPGPKIVYANSAFESMTGYTEEEIMGENPRILQGPETDRDTLDRLRSQLEAGEPWSGEAVNYRKDGTPYVVQWNTAPMRGDDGAIQYWVSLQRDVTERRRLEDALRAERNVLKNVIDASPAAILRTDEQGSITFASARAEDILGLEPKHAERRSYNDPEWGITTPDGEPMPDDELPFARVKATREPVWDARHTIEWPDGTRRQVSVNGAPLRDEDGEWSGGVFVVDDITEILKTQRALKEREARLRGLANSVPGVIYQFYAADDGTYGFNYISDQTESLLEIASDTDDYFERFVERVPENHRDDLLQSIEEAVENQDDWFFEMPFEKPSGDRIWVQGISTPERHEDTLQFTGVLLDVTEKKQLESHLERAQKMEMIGTLAGGVAHDFNNILHTAMTYLELAESSALPDSDVATFVGRAQQGLSRGEKLVQQLLTVGRKQDTTEREEVDLAAVVSETVELASPSLPNHVTVRTDLDDGCTAWGDAGQIQQILLNLVTNAGDAMAQRNGTENASSCIEVRTATVAVDETLTRQLPDLNSGRYARLTVSDDGPGMDAETQDRIFEPFFTTKGASGGTGLGLAMVYGIVSDHGGTVRLQSEEGVGTTFTVFLPMPDSSDASGAEAQSGDDGMCGDPNSTCVDVLVVDDNPDVLALEVERLEWLGCRVVTCASPREALRHLDADASRIDVVLTDYAIGEQTGLDLTRTLRERGLETPVIVMSGFAANITEDDVLEAGAHAFVHKPVGTDEMEITLRGVLDD